MNSFYVEITTGPVLLTADMIWPDGDGPTVPTKADVEQVIREEAHHSAGGLHRLIDTWFLYENMELSVFDGIRAVADEG